MGRIGPLVLTVSSSLLVAAVSSAQPAGPTPRAATTRSAPGWEVEFSGSLSLGRPASRGTVMLPEPGAPIVTSSPIFPSWRVPTWFLGDGAAFVNNVAGAFGVAGRIAPLDDALGPAGVSDAGSFGFGARVRRRWRARLAVEAGVDIQATSAGVSDALREAIDETHASFRTTFTELLATGPFTGPTISTSSAITDGSNREIAVTGALVFDLAPVGGVVPFIVAGGGLLAQAGRPPEVSLEGRYRFTIVGTVPVEIDERDRLTLRYGQRAAAVALVGGGLRRDLSPKLALRAEARLLLGPSTTRVALDARPQSATGGVAGYVESFTYPNLQFSNSASTGRESTLSGTLDGFDALRGGWQARVRVTIGLVARF